VGLPPPSTGSERVPELPEVETVIRGLRRSLSGVRITAVHCLLASVVTGDVREFRRAVEGRRLEGFGRHGKFIFLLLEGGVAVAVHLRMTGQLLLAAAGQQPDKHTHLELATDLPGRKIVYRDVRKFGRFALAAAGVEPFVRERGLGPDALTATPQHLAQALARTSRSVKAALLDQSLVAGLGNIYTDEILYRARLSPLRPANSLSSRDTEAVCESMREILYAAIADSGTTISDYVDPEGRPGAFQVALRVYGRAGQRCPRCGEPIRRAVVAGRGTWYCPRCQG
jgi:formamidopyrimidine-DNA glycosylase